MEFTPETILQIKELAVAGMGPVGVTGGNIPYALVPEGYKVQTLPELIFNEHTSSPERVKARVTVFDPASFIEYYSLFSDENSRTFADETTQQIVSILDYHGAREGAPRWGAHRQTLKLNLSKEWEIWNQTNSRHMSQQDFAEFLEQNASDITKPSAADMMNTANDLHATTEVEFGSGLRQQDGQVKFKYTETTKTSVGGGQVEVPDRFTISIPAFVGGERVAIEALLRFRCNQGKLTFWFTLIRPHEVLRSAFIAARDAIAKAIGIPIINGVPSA